MVRPRARRVAEAGFTLIELLVAMVISGIVLSVIYQVIAGQGRYVELQSAREEVQQNARAALELIGSELRTLPPGTSLVRASADSITLRSARVWGVVCDGSGTSLQIALPALGGASYAINAGTGVVLNLGSAAAPLWSDPVTVSAIGGPLGTCTSEALPVGVENRTFTLAAVPQNGSATPSPGDIIYLYDQVTYRAGESGNVPGRWIQRRLGDGGANQPMAGPIQAGGAGLRFHYFAGAGTAPIPAPITDPAIRESVTRIMVIVEAISRNPVGETRTSKADTALVSLRNRL